MTVCGSALTIRSCIVALPREEASRTGLGFYLEQQKTFDYNDVPTIYIGGAKNFTLAIGLLAKYNQRRNSFIRGPLVRFGWGPYLYIFIKSHMLIN